MTRGTRTKSAWVLALLLLAFSRPTPGPLVVGAVISAVGLVIRGWSAGTIRKDESLTTSGPYAFTRNPLYLGSFLIGVGLGTAGGHWVWPVLVIIYFVAVYGRTIADETARLIELFGERYLEYAARVPTLVPRLRPYRSDVAGETSGFRWRQYVRNREWEALLGTLGALAILAARMRWPR
ncbi:MAG TPA: isoprenylcysteine carboxylmethyltransferase family protein [Longimicrobiales bacterium]|nr:isoprenylcysteine carboxylmethyltransferase family protein [Longimicrobiales bacterium]